MHAALAVGSIHEPVGLTVERSYGEGRVVISTFRLFRDRPGEDPTATILFDALIGSAAAPLAFQEGVRERLKSA